MKRKYLINILIFVILAVIAVHRFYYRNREFKRSEFMLDTIVEITISAAPARAEAILDSTFKYISQLENELSYYQENSKVWKLNHCQSDSCALDEHIYRLLSISEQYYQMSEGLYDVSIGALSQIWDFEQELIPDPAEISNALSSVGLDKFDFNHGFLTRPYGYYLNFGSLAKGYLVDQAVSRLKQEGITRGIINAGGDIRIFGQPKPLRIGIQHPRNVRGEIIEVIQLADAAVVTSGDYERFFLRNGKRYHHILDPFTGYPSENSISVTIISPVTVNADALSTMLFLLPPDQAIALLDSIPDAEGVIYYLENDQIVQLNSTGMYKYLGENNEK